MRGKMGNFFPGSVGPRDHLEPKIGLLFKMSRLMVIFTGLIRYAKFDEDRFFGKNPFGQVIHNNRSR